jgi:hypothetical protein
MIQPQGELEGVGSPILEQLQKRGQLRELSSRQASPGTFTHHHSTRNRAGRRLENAPLYGETLNRRRMASVPKVGLEGDGQFCAYFQ